MRLLLTVACLAALLLMTSSASASHDPSGGPFDEDFVTGTGGFDFVWGARFDAHSGPLGENPTGTASFVQRLFSASGPVTCLTVDGSRAVVGGRNDGFSAGDAYLFLVEDNAASGTPDRLVYHGQDGVPTSCPSPDDFSFEFPIDVLLTDGDLVVHDASPVPTSKGQCKGNGWRNFPGFKNQGSCISFVNR
jgi:hypothetical protein